ncbi:MAG TPA: hypothetical protein VLT45_03315 [Kofleriaceae bacterium]|nr:hypothetical protein [Kofleriaceae bacterium]
MGSSLGSLCLEALRAPAGVALAMRPLDPETLRARAPKLLTTGDTLDFRTLVPQPGGLFDYKVFGPGTVIDAPAVDLDAPARPPKTQFARLALAAPVPHPLAIAHAPSALAALAGWSTHEVLGCRLAATDARASAATLLAPDSPAARIAELARALDASADGRALVLRELPILPPDLRPLVRLADDRWQTSPINELYRNVFRRNQRLAKTLESGPAEAVAGELAALASALEHLFENEDTSDPLRDVHGETLTSLRGLAGDSSALFAALRAASANTGRSHRATSILFALGFELVP